jgi:hypothetical protein
MYNSYSRIETPPLAPVHMLRVEPCCKQPQQAATQHSLHYMVGNLLLWPVQSSRLDVAQQGSRP